MAHHVLVSLGQHKMFLTYNGGPIFSVTTDRETGHIETLSENMGAAEQAKEPITADEFAGRGSARLLRNDTAGAIADFTDAIKLAPDRADLLVDRAKAHARANHPALAEKDINAALVITPADHSLLTRRAQIKLGKGDKAGALADADAAAAATPKGSLDIMPVVVLYERLGKADRALGLLDPVIDLHRESNSYMALLNTRSWNRGLANADLDHALADSNTAIRRAGPVPAFLDTRALIQLRRKDYAAAIADASAALKATPKLAPSLFFRGLARIATGDGVGGRADIADARAIRPTIDQQFADYGLVGPIVTANPPAQPSKPDGDDDDDQ
jgi:tetratricopeptide (TPR) repeat protein